MTDYTNDGIPTKLTLRKVEYTGTAFVFAESDEEAKRIYRQQASHIMETVTDVHAVRTYNLVED